MDIKNLNLKSILFALGFGVVVFTYQACSEFRIQKLDGNNILSGESSNINEDSNSGTSSEEISDSGIPRDTSLESSWHSHIGNTNDKTFIYSEMDGLENPESTYEIIYVAPPGNGSGGSGTKSDPYQNLKTTLDEALAGQKIYLAPGEYRPNTNLSISAGGSFGRPIYLKTDPELFNASEGRVAVINFENKNLHSALSIHGSYVVIEDIEISNVIGTAVDVFGHWVIIRNNSIHDVNPSGGNNHAGIRIHKPMPWSHQDYANPGQPPKTGKI